MLILSGDLRRETDRKHIPKFSSRYSVVLNYQRPTKGQNKMAPLGKPQRILIVEPIEMPKTIEIPTQQPQEQPELVPVKR